MKEMIAVCADQISRGELIKTNKSKHKRRMTRITKMKIQEQRQHG